MADDFRRTPLARRWGYVGFVGADHLQLVGDFVGSGRKNCIKRTSIKELRVRVQLGHINLLI
jgi:hypothetical protein